MDKLKIALNKENKRRLNKDYYERNYCQILYRLRLYLHQIVKQRNIIL